MSRCVPNKCFKTRAEIEGRAYRMLSFIHDHPSQIPEDQWSVLDHEGSKVLVDKVTLSLMAECQCEFLCRDADSNSPEPSIVAVRMLPKDSDNASVEMIQDVDE